MYKTNRERLDEKIKTFSRFGDTGHGGITRFSLSPEALAARDEICRRCEKLGMTIRTDDMANLYATIPGDESLPVLMNIIRKAPSYRFIVFCDDLSFDADDTSYKSLKAALDGGIEGRPANMIFYATSNRRHLLPRDMIENERSTAINPSEAVQEKVSLSDRFGLWLGFHNCSQDEFLEMIEGYARHYGLKVEPEDLRAGAIAWQATRGSRSGRVAWQYIQDVAGRIGQKLEG